VSAAQSVWPAGDNLGQWRGLAAEPTQRATATRALTRVADLDVRQYPGLLSAPGIISSESDAVDR